MARRRRRKKKQKQRPARPKVEVLRSEDLKSAVQRAREAGLSEEDCGNLEAVIDTLEWVSSELEDKTLTLARLRSLFGLAGSEKTRAVFGDKGSSPAGGESAGDSSADATTSPDGEKDSKPKGHGRHGARDYKGAEVIQVTHEAHKPKDTCPECAAGKLYEQKDRPHRLIRVRGQAPLSATVYELQTLRCNLCGKVFVAEPPPGVGDQKYDETAASMIGLLKYGSGLPFNRLQGLEGNLGIPLPASTQWEIVRDASKQIAPAHEELIRQAAQGEVLHNDDTAAKILSLMKENEALVASGAADEGARTGIFTTGLVAVIEGGTRRIALFMSGRKHAGENAQDVLAERAAELSAPIQMCDGLSRNVPKEFETLLSNCLAHGRRKFVPLVESFPEECRHVLEALGEVFKHDAEAKAEELTAQQRLELHQEKSAPIMDDLEKWMQRQFDERLVEPNSSLGSAITYMQKRWDELTLFLRELGAPLDNNVCERALKKAILHRKNSLFFKTETGARVADVYMSLIHTAELVGENPFDYLVELQRHSSDVESDPGKWMPWNYRATIKEAVRSSPDR